jgi:multiple sugar transport system ATP-binding protein
MASVEFDNVTIAVRGTIVLRDVSLDIADGEFVGVIGPSGSGKTSLIRTIAGFTDVVRGRVLLDGIDVTRTKTADRDVGMVFQEPVMFRTRNVRRNVSFPLEIRRQEAEEIRHRVDAEVGAMHLEYLLTRYPNELSRGETQLVQIARAMVRTQRVLLLDEPLANLDTARQAQMRTELALLQSGYGVTTIMATNDPVDAMTMPSRLVVLHRERVVQVDRPDLVHRSPATIDAAVGTGDCWLLPATVSADREGFWLDVTYRTAAEGAAPAFRHRAWTSALADHIGQQVTLGIRPGDVVVSPTGSIAASVTKIVPGVAGGAYCDVGGWRCGLTLPADVREGDVVRVQVDHLVVFDQVTGLAIT